jgi:acyl dehydratase
MTDLNEEFEKAISYELAEEDIERARLLIGIEIPGRRREHISVATPDAIRNWALGMGDDNPLHIDEDYGPGTRWGAQIASPTFIGHIKSPLRGDPVPKEIETATRSLFRGIHVFVSGGTWDFYRQVYPGDRLYSFSGLESVETKASEFAGRSVVQVSRQAIFNQRVEIVGVYRILTILTARKESRDRGKYADIKPASYTDQDIERIDAIYAAEVVRGAEKRWWEDVAIGDQLTPMVKGPLTVTEIIAFHAGGYGFVPYGLRSSRVGFKNRRRIKPFYIKNELGVPDVAQRLHWDSAWAQAIGNPMAYDYGVMRQSWFQHHVTDWMGDDACLIRLEDSIRKFNYQGDTQFLTGEIVDKRADDSGHVVDIELKMINQRDVETAFGKATVALPSRATGLPLFPAVPPDLAHTAVTLHARHLELGNQQRRAD